MGSVSIDSPKYAAKIEMSLKSACYETGGSRV